MKPANLYATTGTKFPVVRTNPHAMSTNALAAAKPLTEHRTAVWQRRQKPVTPLVAERWEHDLRTAHLLVKYNQVPLFIRHGAHAGIPHISHTFTPPNKDSTETLADVFVDIIKSEFNKGRYLGPFSREELEQEIGPFQSSPLSLVPKSGKPGKYRLIQNLSYPHNNTPTPSINSLLKSDDFPCTWGTFRTICTLIINLPPGAEAAVRDISEAYRIIPLHESQWPGVVVRISNKPELFALNTCNSFGCTTAGGLFGLFGDALADILRSKGIGPICKWVDDFIFFRIPSDHIARYNIDRERNRKILLENGGTIKNGGRLWGQGKSTMDVGHEHFAEDLSSPLKCLRDNHHGTPFFPYGFREIDETTGPLGIPWEASKDIPFTTVVPFIGFTWDLVKRRVSLPESKKVKYLRAISEWNERKTHTLNDVQKLHGKLLYTCLITPRGRAYLTNFEKMMGTFHTHPFTPRHPPHKLNEDIAWWIKTLSSPSLSREIPGGKKIFNVQGYSDASSSVGIGIVLGKQWRAWRLLPNWKSKGRDIGWAEAVGMELLTRAILNSGSFPGIQIFGDNNGVVEGWWSGRSRNAATNQVFRRIHDLLEENGTILKTRYVHTGSNPADGPSRGIFPPAHLLLPPIELPQEIRPFVIDFNAPPHPSEAYPAQRNPSSPKASTSHLEIFRRQRANANAEDYITDPFQTAPSDRGNLQVPPDHHKQPPHTSKQ
jgi:hypothetical protein